MPRSTAVGAPTPAAAAAATATITPGIVPITAENLPEKSSALAKALVGEPRLREPMPRQGVAIKWHRMVNREAILGQGRGQVAEAPCDHCKNGYGPFNIYVVLPGRLGGSCSNCHYNSSGARC